MKSTGFAYKISGSHIVIKESESNKKPVQSNKKVTQTVRGVVRDADTGQPISFATIILLTAEPMLSTFTDSLGVFRFDKVPVGRHDLEISYVGYEPMIIKEIALSSAKESYSKKSSPTLSADFTFSYKLNRKKVAHEFSVKILNITNTPEVFGCYYDKVVGEVKKEEVRIMLPNISYEIHF